MYIVYCTDTLMNFVQELFYYNNRSSLCVTNTMSCFPFVICSHGYVCELKFYLYMGKYLHARIISLTGDVRAHNDIVTLPLFVKCLYQDKRKNAQSCIYAMGIDCASFYDLICQLDIGTVPTVSYSCVVFLFIANHFYDDPYLVLISYTWGSI